MRRVHAIRLVPHGPVDIITRRLKIHIRRRVHRIRLLVGKNEPDGIRTVTGPRRCREMELPGPSFEINERRRDDAPDGQVLHIRHATEHTKALRVQRRAKRHAYEYGHATYAELLQTAHILLAVERTDVVQQQVRYQKREQDYEHDKPDMVDTHVVNPAEHPRERRQEPVANSAGRGIFQAVNLDMRVDELERVHELQKFYHAVHNRRNDFHSRIQAQHDITADLTENSGTLRTGVVESNLLQNLAVFRVRIETAVITAGHLDVVQALVRQRRRRRGQRRHKPFGNEPGLIDAVRVTQQATGGTRVQLLNFGTGGAFLGKLVTQICRRDACHFIKRDVRLVIGERRHGQHRHECQYDQKDGNPFSQYFQDKPPPSGITGPPPAHRASGPA